MKRRDFITKAGVAAGAGVVAASTLSTPALASKNKLLYIWLALKFWYSFIREPPVLLSSKIALLESCFKITLFFNVLSPLTSKSVVTTLPKDPVDDIEPLTLPVVVILLKSTLSVLPKLWTWSKLFIKALDVVSRFVSLNENEPLFVFNAEILDVIEVILTCKYD